MATEKNKRWIGILIIVVIGVVAYFLLTMPDRRTAGEKVGDAVEQLDNGVDNAARELQDRTPAERIGDNIEDATDSQ